MQDLSANTGSANSKIGNPNLEAIGNIRDLFPAEGSRGETMATFYVKYGPNRVETVLDGHCEAVSCLYLALTGTKDIWTKARQDIADTFAASVTAFTGTRQNHPTEWKSALTVVTAAAGLAATWVTGPVGALVTGIAATGGFLGTVVGELQSGAGGATSNPYHGSTPQKVLEDLHAAMQALSDRIKAREQAIASMLDKMLGLVTDGGNRANFHVNATPGLDPTFAHGDDIIDMKFPVLREIGYTMMPQIASAFYDGSDAALAGKVTYPWSRLAWGLATEGAYPSWANLVNMVYPLMDDNGAELVKAGQHLAEAAGYLEAADQTGATALGQHAKEVDGAGLGWTKAHVDPPPAPPEPRHGGPQRVI